MTKPVCDIPLPCFITQPADFEFYDPQSPIYTSPRVLPPATLVDCKVVDAIIAQGATVYNSKIHNAVIGLRSTIGKGCTIQVGVSQYLLTLTTHLLVTILVCIGCIHGIESRL